MHNDRGKDNGAASSSTSQPRSDCSSRLYFSPVVRGTGGGKEDVPQCSSHNIVTPPPRGNYQFDVNYCPLLNPRRKRITASESANRRERERERALSSLRALNSFFPSALHLFEFLLFFLSTRLNLLLLFLSLSCLLVILGASLPDERRNSTRKRSELRQIKRSFTRARRVRL